MNFNRYAPDIDDTQKYAFIVIPVIYSWNIEYSFVIFNERVVNIEKTSGLFLDPYFGHMCVRVSIILCFEMLEVLLNF